MVTGVCYGHGMDAPRCRICGIAEFNHSCAGSESLSNLPKKSAKKKRPTGPGLAARGVDEVVVVPADEYVELKADAERWRRLRAKRKEYMRGRRGKA